MAASRSLADVAEMVRCKSAGPTRWTFEVMFKDAETYERVKRERILSPEQMATLYRVPVDTVLAFIEYDPAKTIKVTMRRAVEQGAPGDRDCVGAQFHLPLAGVELPA